MRNSAVAFIQELCGGLTGAHVTSPKGNDTPRNVDCLLTIIVTRRRRGEQCLMAAIGSTLYVVFEI
ncbi:hypothetical protein GCM10007159_05380 [Modicisalibacter luteus]|nr:hypothetical protein GCM10007159_05380 [Halomonas lutea]